MSTSRAICKLQMSSHYNIKYMGQLIILFSSLEYASLYFKYMAKQVKDNVYILKIISWIILLCEYSEALVLRYKNGKWLVTCIKIM